MPSSTSDGGGAAASSAGGHGASAILNGSEFALVSAAFNSFFDSAGGHRASETSPPDSARLVPLAELQERFNAVEHPRVKEGTMAPSAARDTLLHHFGQCAAEHENNGVTFDEFVAYHDKLVDEAFDERGVTDVEAFIAKTIMRLWRLGDDLLLPTGIRPCFAVSANPTGLYASQMMTLVWPEPDPDPHRKGKFVLKGIPDVVRPVFKRGNLPEEVQGYFAYPEELAGMAVQLVKPQISVQRWLDFVWSYAEGKYCGVPGILSARIDRDTLPPSLNQFVMEHEHAAKVLQSRFVPTSVATNPMYKRSSDSYGYRVDEECKKLHAWKVRSLTGKQYGLQYQGLQGKFFSKMSGPTTCNAATGINL